MSKSGKVKLKAEKTINMGVGKSTQSVTWKFEAEGEAVWAENQIKIFLANVGLLLSRIETMTKEAIEEALQK
jgi:hypothetical protein